MQAANVVNVYNWSGYIPEKVLQLFTKQTGITVNYSTFDSNQELYAKLKASPNAGYDVIVPSANFVTKMRDQHMLQPLDKSKIPNLKNLNPWLMNRSFDPHNRYSIPYLWGTTAIIINTKYYPHVDITSWQQLWNKKFRDQLLLLNSAREVFAVALKSLGYSLNDTNPQHLRQAYQKLIKLLPNIKLFNGEASQTIFMDEDAMIGIILNGDAYLAQQQNPNLRYIFPREGVNIWIDNIAIPKNAPHLKNAYRFINFLLQPKIAKMIALDMHYSSPNLAAIRLMPKNIRDNHILYPTKAELKHSEFQRDVGAANHLYQHYWALLKING